MLKFKSIRPPGCARAFNKNKKGTGKLKVILLTAVIVAGAVTQTFAGEDLYKELSYIARGKGDASIFLTLNTESRKLDWEQAEEAEFIGHLRLLKAEKIDGPDEAVKLYMVRNINGDIHILSVPPEDEIKKEGPGSPYHNLSGHMGTKGTFEIIHKEKEIEGETYSFAQLVSRPQQLFLDRVFNVAIVLMLFFVMAGMGLTLTLKDFKLVFQNPKAILTGAGLQWIIMPLIAVGIGHLLGFYESYPFIFVGMVLIAATPGGVTSNLMTFYAKGDLALSVSLTSLSTVLSLFFTPFLLALYCANVPEVTIPAVLIIQTIIILVIIPLTIGMSVRSRWENFAIKATPFFSLLGIIALLFLISAGILANLDVFTDTERYGVKFYSMVFMLTLLGMAVGAVIPKLLGVNNYQTRAVSLETGLRNASLAMAIALLIQDYMGDFYSSMFMTSAMFGIFMYFAGFLAIRGYRKVLPVEDMPEFEIKSDDEIVR